MNWTDEERELAAELHIKGCYIGCTEPVGYSWLRTARELLVLERLAR